MMTASFTGIVKTILIILLVYYGLKFLLRLFAPVIVQKVVNKAGRSFYEQQQQYAQNQNQSNSRKAEPAANIQKEKKKVGEYIDYEEIE